METNKTLSFNKMDSNELILLDDELVLQYEKRNEDLYDELVKEPQLIKQDSIKYDYRPNLKALFNYDQNISQGTHQGQQEISSQEKSLKLESWNSEGSSGKLDKVVKCKCSKTKCQKNYCDCFRAGLPCNQECVCIGCGNDAHGHELMKLKKKQATGCKCKKSKCSKNYCECHNAGKKCTAECICQQCQNMEEKEKQLIVESEPRKRVKLDYELPSLFLGKGDSSKLFPDLY